MSEQTPQPPQPHRHVEVVSAERATDMADAAGRIGSVALKVIGSEGQPYPLHGGGELLVPAGSMAVEITSNNDGPEGTSQFYAEANSLTAARKEQARPKTS